MKIGLITLMLLILCGCIENKNNQNKIIMNIDTLEQSINSIKDRDIIYELHKKYQDYNVDYYNDLNYLGLGVVNPKKFEFEFITDTISKTKFDIKGIEEQEYLIPIFWKPYYLIFYMPVISISSKYYEVRVNADMSVFVNKEDFNFYTWEELFTKKTLSVSNRDGYIKKDVESEVSIPDDINVFLVVEKYDENWLFVNEVLEDDSKKDAYWIKWHEGTKLLIKPAFLM